MELPAGLEVGGQAGTIVWMLLGAISVMATVVAVLYRANLAATSERIEEMRAFAKIVTDNTLAHRENAIATQALALNLKDLTTMVGTFAATQQQIAQRVDHHHETNVDKLESQADVIRAIADAMRALNDNVGRAVVVRGG